MSLRTFHSLRAAEKKGALYFGPKRPTDKEAEDITAFRVRYETDNAEAMADDDFWNWTETLSRAETAGMFLIGIDDLRPEGAI